MKPTAIRTLVVEDEPLIADAHRAYVERIQGFAAVGVVNSGGAALRFLAEHQVDLVLLDLYLPDVGGLEVCRTMRAQGYTAGIIAVTSARDLEIVRRAVAQGIVQYLLKPFTFAAFRDRLERYAEYHRALTMPLADAAQHDIDRALATLRGGETVLPKGLSSETLATVIETLRAAPDELSAGRLATELGISRVTARRYLEHLADQGLAERRPRYGGPGRPVHDYRWRAGQGPS